MKKQEKNIFFFIALLFEIRETHSLRIFSRAKRIHNFFSYSSFLKLRIFGRQKEELYNLIIQLEKAALMQNLTSNWKSSS